MPAEPLQNLSDEELAVRVVEKEDVSAFDILHRRYRQRILNYVCRLTGNFQRAEDITQEVFLKVYEKLDTFDPERKFSSWLYRIATNTSINEVKKKGRAPTTISLDEIIADKGKGVSLIDLLPDERQRPDFALRRKEFEKKIQEAINSLPVRYRTVFVLCYLQGHSYKEAAQILKCNPSSVGVWLKRARERFIRSLDLGSFPVSFFINFKDLLSEGYARMSNMLTRGLTKISHLRVGRGLSRYYDGETSAAEDVRLRAHIAVCPKCKEQLTQFEKLSVILEQVGSFAVSASYEEVFRQKFQERFGKVYEEAAELPLAFRLRQRWQEVLERILPPFPVPTMAPALVRAAATITIFATLSFSGYYANVISMPSVVSTKGLVQVYKPAQDRWVVAREGLRIRTGDVIKVGADGQIDFSSKNTYAIRAKAHTELKASRVLAFWRKGMTIFDLSEGKMLAKTLKGFRNSEFIVETPTAEVMVFGTAFFVYVDPAGITEVITLKGRPEPQVINKILKGKPVELKAGFATIVPPKAIPTEPRLVPETELERLHDEINQIGMPPGPEPLAAKERFEVALVLPTSPDKIKGRVKSLFKPAPFYIGFRGPKDITKLAREAVREIDEAVRENDKEKHLLALAKLREISEKISNSYYSPQILLHIAASLVYVGEHEAAVKTFKEVAEEPAYKKEWATFALCAIGVVQEEYLNNWKEAIKAYQEASKVYDELVEEYPKEAKERSLVAEHDAKYAKERLQVLSGM